MSILTVNLLLSTVVFWICARLYLVPALPRLGVRAVLMPILLLHAMRHLGLMFLAPGAVYEGLPREFAYPAAIGDALASLLALAAIVALSRGWGAARAIVWAFAVEGALDLLLAIALATLHDADRYMGPAYWIPAFWVPTLLVTHYIVFVVLLRHWGAPAMRGAPT